MYRQSTSLFVRLARPACYYLFMLAVLVGLPVAGVMLPFEDVAVNVLSGLVAILGGIIVLAQAIRDMWPDTKAGKWLRTYW